MKIDKVVERLESIIKEAHLLKSKTIEEKGSNFLKISNKDLLLWIASRQISNERELAVLKAKFNAMAILVTGIIIAIIGNNIMG